MSGEKKNTPPEESTRDLQIIIFELEAKIEKAKQNDKIVLVDFWVNIIFRCENVRVIMKISLEKKYVGFHEFH